MELPALTPSLIIFSVIAVTTLYSVLGGKFRLKLLVLSTFVGIVLAGTLPPFVRTYAMFLTPEQLTFVLLGLPILLFGLARGHGLHDRGSIVPNFLGGVAAGLLLSAAALRLLPPSLIGEASGTMIVGLLDQYYPIWLVTAPLLVAFGGFLKPHEGHHKR